MLILGIDPGLNTTGYGIILKNQNKLKFIEAGFIRTSARDNIKARLLKIYNELSGIVKKYQLDAMVLEKLYAHYKHPLTACLLGHARGIICLVCAQNNIKLFEYAATRTKKAISGRGSASKLQVQHMVLNTLGLKDRAAIPLDITDALSLAIAHSYIARSADLSAFASSYPVQIPSGFYGACKQLGKSESLTLAACVRNQRSSHGHSRGAQFRLS